MKYAPRKVYIKESGGYVELSYTDFCRRRQADRQIALARRAGDSGDGGDSDIGIPPVTVIDA